MVQLLLLISLLGTALCTSDHPDQEQLFAAFAAEEQGLMEMAQQIIVPASDAARLEQNEMFRESLLAVLLRDDSFVYPFDSLKTVSIQTCPLGRFRMFTWYVPLSRQRFHYFGVLQLPTSEPNQPSLIELHDATSEINWREAGTLDPEQWPGAWYYDMVHFRLDDIDWYLLLGWKGDNPLTRVRIIEPFGVFDGQALFGAQVFGQSFEGMWRIIFEYSSSVSMSLLVEDDFFKTESGRHDMVVFDRLAPLQERLKGNFQFYVPEANIFDGLYFSEGKWNLVRDVDARLPERGE